MKQAPTTNAEPGDSGFGLSFLADPYLWVYGGFLAVMVALSFAIEPVADLAMSLRWPVLGVAALAGIAYSLGTGLGRTNAAHGAMISFIALAMLSSAYALEFDYTLERAISIGLLFSATGIGIFSYCRSMKNALRFTDLMWALGALLVAGGFAYRAVAGVNARYEGIHDRATGAGTYAALFVPIALYQVRYRFRGVMQFIGWGVVGLLLVQILLSGARMAILTTALSCLVLLLDYYGRKAAAGLCIAGVLAVIPLVLDHRNMEKIQEKSDRIVRAESVGTFTGRLDRWVFGIEQFLKKPIFGHGLGSSRMIAGLEDPRRFHLDLGEVFNLHSDQIEVLMDLGIVGFLPFAIFWIALGACGLACYRGPQRPGRQLALAYFAGAFYAFVDTFMHGGFLAAGGGVSSYTWSVVFVFFALHVKLRHLVPPGSIPRQWRRDAPQPGKPVSRPRRLSMAAFASAGGKSRKPRRLPVDRKRLPSVRRMRPVGEQQAVGVVT